MTVLLCVASVWLIGVVWFCREVIHSLTTAKADLGKQTLPPMPKLDDWRPDLRILVVEAPAQAVAQSQSIGAEGPFEPA
jgi:hypothetical protein